MWTANLPLKNFLARRRSQFSQERGRCRSKIGVSKPNTQSNRPVTQISLHKDAIKSWALLAPNEFKMFVLPFLVDWNFEVTILLLRFWRLARPNGKHARRSSRGFFQFISCVKYHLPAGPSHFLPSRATVIMVFLQCGNWFQLSRKSNNHLHFPNCFQSNALCVIWIRDFLAFLERNDFLSVFTLEPCPWMCMVRHNPKNCSTA